MADINATVHFGAFDVAVKVVKIMATKNGSVAFKTLHAEGHDPAPITQKRFCTVCGELVTAENATSGYEDKKGHYIVVSKEEQEEVAAVKSTTIEIAKWIEPIDPVWYDEQYWLAPGAIVPASYGILAQAMENTGMQGFGNSVLYRNEHPFVVSAKDGVLYYTTLHSEPEFKIGAKPNPIVSFDPKHVKWAEKAIMAWASPLEEGDLVVTKDVLMRSLIASKMDGTEFVIPEPETPTAPTVDIQDALKDTIAMAPKKRAAA